MAWLLGRGQDLTTFGPPPCTPHPEEVLELQVGLPWTILEAPQLQTRDRRRSQCVPPCLLPGPGSGRHTASRAPLPGTWKVPHLHPQEAVRAASGKSWSSVGSLRPWAGTVHSPQEADSET